MVPSTAGCVVHGPTPGGPPRRWAGGTSPPRGIPYEHMFVPSPQLRANTTLTREDARKSLAILGERVIPAVAGL